MNTFVNAIKNAEARTTNGMKARESTANALVDFFFNAGASRGKSITPLFVAAIAEDRELALRLAAWLRDARGGAGERELFREILRYLEKNDAEAAAALIPMIPELGRYDDLLVFTNDTLKSKAFTLLGDALRNKNGLAAKWTPRKGALAAEIRTFFGMTPKQYRKSLVTLTNVVETAMCSGDWDTINYSHVPSLAHARYKKAFGRHGTTYADYVNRLVKGEAGVKVNAGAVFPYDVLKGRINAYGVAFNQTELDLIQKQWEALPNFIGDARVLPLVDVSGSMGSPAGGTTSKSMLTCLEVAVSLGLYFADKNKGAFKDTFLTFSGNPELLHLKGGINQKIDQMVKSSWDMNTDLHKAFDKILTTAVKGKVSQEEMPETLVIFSDMQFDRCTRYDDTAQQMIERKYANAGYVLPKIVFWNLNSSGHAPVKFNTTGVALVSGFSPAIAASILGADPDAFTPEAIMLKTIMQDKYKVL